MKLTKKYLHQIERELINLCEDNEIMKEAIINRFTDLMSKVKE